LHSLSQSLGKNEMLHLVSRIETFIDRQHETFAGYKETELAFVILETDSLGGVKSIHAKGTANDTLFHMLNRMPLRVFDGWKSKECKRKIIVVPYVYSSCMSGGYVSKMYVDYFIKIPHSEVIKESGDVIIIKCATSQSPCPPKE
jgi:hypothetical protein